LGFFFLQNLNLFSLSEASSRKKIENDTDYIRAKLVVVWLKVYGLWVLVIFYELVH